MYCPNCGARIDNNMQFCSECGSPVQTVNDSAQQQSLQETKVMPVQETQVMPVQETQVMPTQQSPQEAYTQVFNQQNGQYPSQSAVSQPNQAIRNGDIAETQMLRTAPQGNNGVVNPASQMMPPQANAGGNFGLPADKPNLEQNFVNPEYSMNPQFAGNAVNNAGNVTGMSEAAGVSEVAEAADSAAESGGLAKGFIGGAAAGASGFVAGAASTILSGSAGAAGNAATGAAAGAAGNAAGNIAGAAGAAAATGHAASAAGNVASAAGHVASATGHAAGSAIKSVADGMSRGSRGASTSARNINNGLSGSSSGSPVSNGGVPGRMPNVGGAPRGAAGGAPTGAPNVNPGGTYGGSNAGFYGGPYGGAPNQMRVPGGAGNFNGGIPSGYGPNPYDKEASSRRLRNTIIAIIAAIAVILASLGAFVWYRMSQSKTSSDVQEISYKTLRADLMKSKKYKDYTVKIVDADVSHYPHVKLYFSLTDKNGKALEINSPTAAIKEKIGGGREAERVIRKVERIKDKQSVNYEIVLDKSGSMDSSMNTMQETMSDFVRTLNYKRGDKAELISFDNYIMYMATYTNDKDRLLNGINSISADGGTALYDALYTGVTNAANHEGFNCVIAFTDGEDNASRHSADDVIELAKTNNIPVYLIGTSDADSSILQNIANKTNGYFWDINSISDMNDILKRIKVNQDNVYCLEYDSDSGSDPYSDRVISALVADSKDHTSGGIGDDLSFKPAKKKYSKNKSNKTDLVMHKEDATWTQANNSCMKDGGLLATASTKEKEQKLIDLAEKEGIKYVWIGGYTSERSDGGIFAHWATGEDMGYENWMPGEPSHTDKDGEPEMYMMLWKVDDQWSWNDQRDNLFSTPYLQKTFSGKTGYVCEVNKTN